MYKNKVETLDAYAKERIEWANATAWQDETYSQIGLRGFWKSRVGSGQRLWRAVGNYFDELRYAWQRAWRGYDDVGIFNLNDRLCATLQLQLIDFYQSHHEIVDNPEVDVAVLQIIDLLGYIGDEKALKELYPDAPVEDFGVFQIPKYTHDQYMTAAKVARAKLKQAFDLLGDNIEALWI